MLLRLNINCKYIEFHHFLTYLDLAKYKALVATLQKACSHTTKGL